VIDGLAMGVMADEVESESTRLNIAGLVHHPLALETGLTDRQRQSLFESERRALSHVRRVIVTSPATARNLSDYGVAPDQIDVVEPGTDPSPLADRSDEPPFHLLVVATITPRKGHAVLVSALADLADLNWIVECYGSLDRDPDCAETVRQNIDRLGLADRIILHGERDQAALSTAYANADALVLPSYHEGYGMVLSEALARGLPIVSTTAGAIPDTVPSDAGILVPSGDSKALAQALRSIVSDRALYRELAEGAERRRAQLPTWRQQAALFAARLDQIVR
jgi:glycosyltransferase involved in cell wall biosynthesis